jgi:hypothetical protein
MATDKTFSVAGISNLNGEYKVRFANDIMRIKVLAKSGHTDIRLDELDGSFDKLTAAKMLLSLDTYQDAIAQSTITEYLAENTPKTAAPKAKTAPVKAPAKAKATTKVAATADMDENIPF